LPFYYQLSFSFYSSTAQKKVFRNTTKIWINTIMAEKEVVNEGSTGADTPPDIKTVVTETGEVIEISADDALLMSLGYQPELKREFSYLTVFGQSFGAMGLAPAIAESIIFSLGSAGSVGMVWTYFVGVILLIPVALSLGELGSSMPTAGGLYYVSCTCREEFTVSRTDMKSFIVGREAYPCQIPSYHVLARGIYERLGLYLDLCFNYLRGYFDPRRRNQHRDRLGINQV
jgi:hypothetical protein